MVLGKVWGRKGVGGAGQGMGKEGCRWCWIRHGEGRV